MPFKEGLMLSNLRINQHLVPLFLITSILSGCGGGGGGGETNAEPLVFDGNTNAARITADNASTIFNDIYGLGNISATAGKTTGPTYTQPLQMGVTRLRIAITDRIDFTVPNQDLMQKSNAARSVNDAYSCIDGGTTSITGELNDDGSGVLNINFTNCTDGNDTLDGTVRYQILDTDMVYSFDLEALMSFSRLTLRGPSYNYTMSGSLHIEYIPGSHLERITSNITTRDNLTGRMLNAENLVDSTTYDYLFDPSHYSITQSGRVYVGDYGYVDISTNKPLEYSDMTTFYPNRGGELLFTGAGNSKAHIIAASALKVRIEVDTEGDDVYNEHFVYYWSDIGGATPPNEPPQVTGITILPASPYTSDNLTVDISNAFDPDADPLNYTYVWSRNGTPISDQASISLSSNQHSKGDVIQVELTISDGTDSARGIDAVTVLNTPPLANAGIDTNLTFGDIFSLDGFASDADNDPLFISWTMRSVPFKENGALSDATILNPDFIYSGQGDYQLQLSVSDGEASTVDTVSISVEVMQLFNPRIAIDIPSSTESTAIGDVNGDGLDDVIVTTSFSLDPNNDSRLFVLLQDASGNLSEPVNYDVGHSPDVYQIRSAAIADMNNDGKSDVIVSYQDGVGVLLQNSVGTLDPVSVYSSNHSSFSNTYKVVATDFNNDGLNDIASIDWGRQSDDVDVFLQNGSGTLNTPATYQAPHDGYDDLAYGDINGDGLNDIVVMSGQSSANQLSILAQQPDNTFGAATIYDIGGTAYAWGVGVGDVNGDNLDDIIVSYDDLSSSAKLAVFYQSSMGTLDAPIQLRTYANAGAVQIADVDDNGLKDIVINNNSSSFASIYLQNADGTLMGEQRYTIRSAIYNPHRLAVGDINADGSNDIVLADGGGISILYHK